MTSRVRGLQRMDIQQISAVTNVGAQVRVLSFARVRELVGTAESMTHITDGQTVGDLWRALTLIVPGLADFNDSIRFACNGNIVPAQTPLKDGDEVALLPPVSGG